MLAISRSAARTIWVSPMTRAARLGGVALGERGVLDLGHGVHGVHQRDAPALGGEPADVAGEPVVGVDEVVVAGAVARPGLHHAVREGAQLGRAAPPWPGPRTGPASTCRTSTPGASSTAGRQAAGGGPREDLDLDVDARRAAWRARRCRRSCRPRRRCRAGAAGRCAR